MHSEPLSSGPRGFPAVTSDAQSRRRDSILAISLDGVSDLAVLGFALWTLLYQAAKLFDWPTNPIVIAWAVGLGAALVTVVHRDRRPPRLATYAETTDSSWHSPWIVVAVGLALASVLLVHSGVGTRWLLGWALAAASGLAAVVHLLGSREKLTDPNTATQPDNHEIGAGGALITSPWSHVVVLLVALGWSVFSLFTLRVDPDDAFYVNKAVFVGENGVIPIRDTIFGDQTLPPLPGAGTAPLQSIEVLQGALAHLFGISPTAVVYLAFPPVLTFLATWAIWRLIREWSQTRALLAFALSMVYLAMAGQTGAGMGVFFLARIWQGKVVFVAALIPLIYLYVTRWSRTGSNWYVVMMGAAGVAAVGLTSSATFIVPIIAVTCAVALLLTRRRWVGLLALAGYPLVTGGIVALTGVPGDPGGAFYAGAEAFHFVLGAGVLAAIGWAGIMLSGWLVPAGAARVIATAATLSLLVVLAPGVASLFSSVTGAGAVAWRLMWLAPVTVMVGLLATVRLPTGVRTRAADERTRHLLGLVVTAALIAALVVTGTPFWSPIRSVKIMSKPTWKYPSIYLNQALAIRRIDPGPGPVLAPLSTMRALSLVSSNVHAVAARPSYIRILTEPSAQHAARITLTEAEGGQVGHPPKAPSQAEFTSALKTLNVSLACVRPSQTKLDGWLRDANWKPRQVRELVCYSPH